MQAKLKSGENVAIQSIGDNGELMVLLEGSSKIISAEMIDLVIMSDNEFETIFIPTEASEGGTIFETYGNDLEKVIATNNEHPDRVWTLLECNGSLYTVQGYQLVNRIGYIITEKGAPWPVKDIPDVDVPGLNFEIDHTNSSQHELWVDIIPHSPIIKAEIGENAMGDYLLEVAVLQFSQTEGDEFLLNSTIKIDWEGNIDELRIDDEVEDGRLCINVVSNPDDEVLKSVRVEEKQGYLSFSVVDGDNILSEIGNVAFEHYEEIQEETLLQHEQKIDLHPTKSIYLVP